MHVLVSEFGAFLGKKSERLVVKEKGEVVAEIPFHDVEQVTIMTTGASLSADMIRQCAEHGIQINFLSSSGDPYAKVLSPGLSGTVATRRQQMIAYQDRRGVELSKALVEGKLRNQVNVLKYFAKYRKSADRKAHDGLYEAAGEIDGIRNGLAKVDGQKIDEVRGTLLSAEGRAANLYWEQVGLIVADKVAFGGREHRGAQDPVNSLLNYGYGMLYHQITSAVILAGLDPFAGFLHVDRPGKMSLVLDFIEEFRPVVVDRLVIAQLGKGTIPKMVEGKLDDQDRRDFAQRVLERLEDQEQYEGKRHKLKSIIQMQARHMATFLRDEGKYRPFVAGW